MTSFDVFALFYVFLNPNEQLTLHVSKKYNIPNTHATKTSVRRMLRKTERKGNYRCR